VVTRHGRRRECAPTAPEEALLGDPSISPLGDALDALADAAIWTLLLMVPCAVLSAAGVLLWRRWRSTATAMIALGFAATLLGLASSLFATYRTQAILAHLTTAPQAQQDTFFVVAHYRYPLATLGLLGMWAAAVGTLWHVRRHR
jgi:hypothetical protein